MSELTLTAKIKINPTDEEKEKLISTVRAIKKGLNYTSEVVYQTGELVQAKLHEKTYLPLRKDYGLKSQMAQSVMKTVISKYKSMQSNGIKDTRAVFKKSEYDLVWNRDYSLVKGLFSLNTLYGRIKVSAKTDGMERFFDGSWSFGTAKLVFKKNKFYLHIPMTTEIQDVDETAIRNVVGVDLGLNFLAVTFDSKDKTLFFSGKAIKNKRGHYKKLRQNLQKRQTPSSRRRLKQIGSRENRWITDTNHCVSKALVANAGEGSLIVLEDLDGVRNATENVRKKDRYVSVSWSYAQLRTMIEYKAKQQNAKMILVDPKYTSQQCPKCGHTEKGNRDKKRHLFQCKTCEYRSNDDRIGAMNLRAKGIQYLSEVSV
ncbi:IS200/IS605 family element transposase accessory protein TnpB (plasmid) [Pontibacillus sp. ALD_SL1]|uniref:RNA-guided endonuclease InsQ/TnpB family protein n=1 Tax=Pontibacillus sp. ALD_SL1 TaxID=2777185 RepID=UPI001A95E2C4|nr:RNA-guided endonuclease TnpB family protein [Pontibacillus sp. ALD_SL1]QST02813.1 IS200/IS605 family element transposase accessory protein TnpB [Pontibacillus sp. ALD_SL1]